MPSEDPNALPKHLTSASMSWEYERWDTVPEGYGHENTRYPPPRSVRKSNRSPPRQSNDSNDDAEGGDDNVEKEIEEDDDSDIGDFDDHVRENDGLNRRMKKISLAWWRWNKGHTTFDVDVEPKIDRHDEPLVRHLKEMDVDNDEKMTMEGEDDNDDPDADQLICRGMVKVLESGSFANHISKKVVEQLGRITENQELNDAIRQVPTNTYARSTR